jgi:hypothetical protein
MTTPAPAPVPSQTAPAEKWNVLSIVGFVLALLQFNVVAVVLGFIGLSQVKKTGERGRGLAIAAIIIGFASIVLWVIIIIVSVALAATSASLSSY